MTLIVHQFEREGMLKYSWWRQIDGVELVIIGFGGYNFRETTQPPVNVKLLKVYKNEITTISIDKMLRMIKAKKITPINRS